MDATQRCIRELLAELEHEQWAHWTSYVLSNLTPENIERWKKQILTLYSELSEKEKDSDRYWADKSLVTLHSKGVVVKVERELPAVISRHCVTINGETAYIEHLGEIGYSAWEPLIIEEPAQKGVDGKPYIVGASGVGSAAVSLIGDKDGR